MATYKFIPKNPHKYIGDLRKITARSKWELIYMEALDKSMMVSAWASEPKQFNIWYYSPLDGKKKQYWPDFFVKYNDGRVEIIEVKPLKEASIAAAKSKYDKLMLVKNIAKWQAAEKFAKAVGAKFRVVTEQQLFK